MIDAFQKSLLSLGQLSKALNLSKETYEPTFTLWDRYNEYDFMDD